MAEVALAAEIRSAQGSSNSRRLRKAGRIPGVMYGHGTDPTSLSVDARSLRIALNGEAGTNALLQLELEGTKHLALARVIQKHPVRGTVAHVDFQVVNRNEQIASDIPINFIGEAENVTRNDGVVEHLLNSLAVTSTPTNIPSQIDVDISGLEIDGAIRVKDVVLPEGVECTLDGEEPIVIAAVTRAALSEDEETAAAEGAEGETADSSSAEAPAEG